MQKRIKIEGDVYAMGDIHGDVHTFISVIKHYDIKNCSIILLGDVGIFRYRDYKRYIQMDKVCQERNIIVYAIRGNHDNPGFYQDLQKSSPIAIRFWNKFTNFKQVVDFTEFEINSHIGIAIGGATSIDRILRKGYRMFSSSNLYAACDWWKHEVLPNTDGIDKQYDFILSHCGPRPTLTPMLRPERCTFMQIDDALEADLIKENEQLEKMCAQLKPKKWWFGHFHINERFDFLETTCYATDICNLSPIQF